MYSAWQAPFAAQKFAPVERWLRDHDSARARRRVWSRHQRCALQRRRLRRHRRQRAIPGGGARAIPRPVRPGRPDERRSVVARHVRHDPRQQLSASRQRSDAERILAQLSPLLAPEGTIHILDLVLPPRKSLAWMMARLDRGKYARPVERWRACSARRSSRFFEPYFFGGRLWSMVYFQGRKKREALRRHSCFQRTGSPPELLARLLQGPRSASKAGRTKSSSSTMAAPTIRGRCSNRPRGAIRAFGRRAVEKFRPSGRAWRRARLRDRRCGRPDGRRSAGRARSHPEFVAHHRAGADVVFARRRTREEGWLLRLAYRAFYRIISALSDTELPLDTGISRCSGSRWWRRFAACRSTSDTFEACGMGRIHSRSASTSIGRRAPRESRSTRPGN